MQFRHILRGATIVFLVVATTGSAQAADPTPGGTLNFAVVAGPLTYDLHFANSFSVIHYLASHEIGLTRN